MRKQPAVATRTEEPPTRVLPLETSEVRPPRPTQPPERRAADRIKDALLRWLEEKM
jgi:hypothetical protein